MELDNDDCAHAIHVGAVVAFFFSWGNLMLFLVSWLLGLNVSIGMCYHRLLTHRGYRVPRWLEYIFAILGTLSLQGSPVFWVATHRVHYQLTEKPGDPHSPQERQQFSTKAACDSRWIFRKDHAEDNTTALQSALEGFPFPEGDGFIWIAAETSVAKRLYTYLGGERHHPKEWIKTAGDWSQGQADASERIA